MNDKILEISQKPISLDNLWEEEKDIYRNKISELLWENKWDVLKNNDVEGFLKSWFFWIFLFIVLNNNKYKNKNFKELEEEFCWEHKTHIWNPDKNNLEEDFYDIIQEYFIKSV